MKPSIRPALPVIILFGSAVLFLGCRAQSTYVSQTSGLLAPAATNVLTNASNSTDSLGIPGAEGAANAAPPGAASKTLGEKLASGEAKLPESLAGIINLAQGGVGEEVLLAYVQNYPAPFNLTAEEILYLSDLGISELVISAMIKHNGITPGIAQQQLAPATNAVPGSPVIAATNQPISAVPAPNQVVLMTNAPSFAVTATPEFEAGAQPAPMPYTGPVGPVQYNYFYSSLDPYGSWYDVPDYGMAWQPTVAVVDSSWQPYCQRGRWIYSNYGWYWHSDYSWGWAPFHYGRWRNHPGRGWLWIPDTTWGPAWVTWRYSDAFCGWAPLPPGARFVDGFGFRYHTRGVGISFDFGLSADCYTFIPTGRFIDPHPWRHRLSSPHVVNVFNRTTIINNYSQGPNKVIINEGIERRKIAALTRSEIRKAEVRDLPPNTVRSIRPDRLERNGSDLVVYRSSLPAASAEVATTRGGLEIRKTTAPNTNLTPGNRVRAEAAASAGSRGGAARVPEALGKADLPSTAARTDSRNSAPPVTRIPSRQGDAGTQAASQAAVPSSTSNASIENKRANIAETPTVRSFNTARPNTRPSSSGVASAPGSAAGASTSPSGRVDGSRNAQSFGQANEPRGVASNDSKLNPTPAPPLQRRESLRSTASSSPRSLPNDTGGRSPSLRPASELETRLMEYQAATRAAPATQPPASAQPVLRTRALTERSSAAPYAPPPRGSYAPPAPSYTSQPTPGPQYRQELSKPYTPNYSERRGYAPPTTSPSYEAPRSYAPRSSPSAPPSRGAADYGSSSRSAPSSSGSISVVPSSRPGPPPTQIQPSQLTPSPRSSSPPPSSSGNSAPSRSSGSNNGKQGEK